MHHESKTCGFRVKRLMNLTRFWHWESKSMVTVNLSWQADTGREAVDADTKWWFCLVSWIYKMEKLLIPNILWERNWVHSFKHQSLDSPIFSPIFARASTLPISLDVQLNRKGISQSRAKQSSEKCSVEREQIFHVSALPTQSFGFSYTVQSSSNKSYHIFCK